MKIISFYTNNDPDYIKYAKNLKRSCFYYGLDLYMEPCSVKTWPEAIKYKVKLITTFMQGNPNTPFLYVDGDCEFRNDPVNLFNFIEDHDLSLRARNLDDKYNAGVMGFGRDTKKLLPFVEEWWSLTKKTGSNYSTVDQKPLEITLKAHPEIRVGELTHLYNFLSADRKNFPGTLKDCVVRHYKISRINTRAKTWKKLKDGN